MGAIARRARTGRWLGAFALALLGAACAPGHTVPPYADDAQRAAELEARAGALCAEQRAVVGREDLPPEPFVTDGCSAWPDADWVDCCVEHDIAYWCGGSAEQRQEGDQRFRECVARDHGDFWGGTMYWGVRAGGSAWWPLPWRWGYGWPAFHGYEEPAAPAADAPSSAQTP